MSSEVDVSLHSQEDADMSRCLDFHKAKKSRGFSLWPLDDEPLLWFEAGDDRKPDWDKDPPHFSYLWRQNSDIPMRIPGPHIRTNLFGRTATEVFADFPTDFYDSPSPPSSPSLSPVSPAFPPASINGETSGQPPTIDPPDTSIDEVTQQLSQRIRLDSPPQSPFSVEPPYIANDDTALPPPSPSMCNLFVSQLTIRHFLVLQQHVVGGIVEHCPVHICCFTVTLNHAVPALAALRLQTPDAAVPHLNQIVLEEHPVDVARRRRSTRSGSHTDVNEDLELAMDDIDPHRRKKAIKARKRHPCTVDGCTESFTRLNDVLRHIKNAAIHKGTVQQEEALAAANSTASCNACNIMYHWN
ncbi:hypothetical protein B0H11DRAFT_1906743 [Mycena galericulata]|nr:hypothetical protein B0H11DRAFT_1906743 [Mycena galericulata]